MTKRNERRKNAARDVKNQKIKTHRQICSRVFSLEYLKKIPRDTYSILNNQGLFIAEEEVRIQKEMIPWLVDLTVSN